MPSPNPTTSRDYKGAAKATTLSAQIVNGTDTTFTIVDATGWPDGSSGKFMVTINAGQTDEEKILCLSRSGTTVTKDTRGFDGTTAAGHAAGATAVHTISAFDAAEWNAHTAATSAVHGHTGAAVGTSDTQTLTNKTLTAPVIATISNTGTITLPTATDTLVGRATTDTLTNKTLTAPTINTPTTTGMTADATSTIGGVSGTSLAADRTAWSAWTPTFTHVTGSTGDFYYKQVGKTLYLRLYWTAGTNDGSPYTFTLPNGALAAGSSGSVGQIIVGVSQSLGLSFLRTVGGSNVVGGGASNFGGSNGTSAAGSFLTGVIEVA